MIHVHVVQERSIRIVTENKKLRGLSSTQLELFKFLVCSNFIALVAMEMLDMTSLSASAEDSLYWEDLTTFSTLGIFLSAL